MSLECKKVEKCCFCCKDATSHENSQSSNGEMDMIRLNSALHELGLLSSVTESRKQYLQESSGATKNVAGAATSPKETAPPPPPPYPRKGFCVLHMNSNYVTDFSGTWKTAAPPLSKRAYCTENISNHFKSRDYHQAPRRFRIITTPKSDRPCQGSGVGLKSSRCRQRFQKPYEIPWMHKVEISRACWVPESDSSSKDSGLGNRSNPGSPEKVPVDSPSGLVRSRSLDDIEAIHHPDAAVCSSLGQKSELESMSQCMEDLHVN